MLRSSKDWLAGCLGVSIVDPDGWDRQNYDFSFNKELISFDEFSSRLSKSTLIQNMDNADLVQYRNKVRTLLLNRISRAESEVTRFRLAAKHEPADSWEWRALESSKNVYEELKQVLKECEL